VVAAAANLIVLVLTGVVVTGNQRRVETYR